MKTKQWDRDIAKGIVTDALRIDELKIGVFNLWDVVKGDFSKKPPMMGEVNNG